MKTGAMVLGIIGGLIALVMGLFYGYGLGTFVSFGGNPEQGANVKLLAIAIPVLALVGAGIVKSQGLIGGGIMVCAAIIFVLLLGINMVTVIRLSLWDLPER